MPKRAKPAAEVEAEGEMPLLLTIKRACHELGDVSERHVYNLINNNLLERIKLGRSSRITSASVRRLALPK